MGETSNIAKMASLASKDIFESFGWSINPLMDQRWDCHQQEKHNKLNHPSDVVFYYDHPYSQERIYINTDLKSYGSKGITRANITTYVNSLGLAVDCAKTSEKWKNLYVIGETAKRIHGLLFYYNHDNGYENDFSRVCSEISEQNIEIPEGNEIYVMGPQKIHYLYTIANDIQRLSHSREFPRKGEYKFFYPQTTMKKAEYSYASAASIEMLMGAWQIFYFNSIDDEPKHNTYFIYSPSTTGTEEEFLYLFSYLHHYQLIGNNQRISIRMPFAQNGASQFEKAIVRYFEGIIPNFIHSKATEAIKSLITFDCVTNIVKIFSEEAIGRSDG